MAVMTVMAAIAIMSFDLMDFIFGYVPKILLRVRAIVFASLFARTCADKILLGHEFHSVDF